MGNEKIGDGKGLTGSLEKRDDLELEAVVQGGKGFVHHQHAGIGKNCPADCYALLLASREVTHTPLQKIPDLQHVHQIFQGDFALIRGTTPVAIKEVPLDGEVGKKMGALKDHADASVLCRDIHSFPTVKNGLSVNGNKPSVRMVQPGDETHEGGFAATGGAEDPDPVANNREIHFQGKRPEFFLGGDS